jgi:hypothetical protein
MRSRYDRRSGQRMTLSERFASKEHNHLIFANWVTKIGVLGNSIVIFLTIVGIFAVPIALITSSADFAIVKTIMFLSLTWALIGVYARERVSALTDFKKPQIVRKHAIIAKIIVGIIAAFVGFFGYLSLLNFDTLKGTGGVAVGTWFASIVFLAAIGSLTEPLRLAWRLILKTRKKNAGKLEKEKKTTS